jgi:hypothetical protein
VEKLRVRQKELEDAQLQRELEHLELEREIERRRDDGRACAIARNVNWRIIEDDEDLPYFSRVN